MKKMLEELVERLSKSGGILCYQVYPDEKTYRKHPKVVYEDYMTGWGELNLNVPDDPHEVTVKVGEGSGRGVVEIDGIEYTGVQKYPRGECTFEIDGNCPLPVKN